MTVVLGWLYDTVLLYSLFYDQTWVLDFRQDWGKGKELEEFFPWDFTHLSLISHTSPDFPRLPSIWLGREGVYGLILASFLSVSWGKKFSGTAQFLW